MSNNEIPDRGNIDPFIGFEKSFAEVKDSGIPGIYGEYSNLVDKWKKKVLGREFKVPLFNAYGKETLQQRSILYAVRLTDERVTPHNSQVLLIFPNTVLPDLRIVAPRLSKSPIPKINAAENHTIISEFNALFLPTATAYVPDKWTQDSTQTPCEAFFSNPASSILEIKQFNGKTPEVLEIADKNAERLKAPENGTPMPVLSEDFVIWEKQF